MSLDFISFLLSKVAPNTAKTTMSPTLQDAVPIGTLEARMMKYTPPASSESRSAQLVSRAYKLQGFSNAADKILGAASRLEEEATKEQRYWEQILSIKQKGWSLIKVPRDPRTLGVHFGFRDATPSFRIRGFAALRRKVDGGLRLDQGAVPSRPVAVQISLLRDGKSCGTSAISCSQMASEEAIDEQILQARNTLYEEELFHELGREARLLANQGATMSSKCIKMPLDDQTRIQIELINVDNDNDNPIDGSGSDQQLANGIAIALRILLSHAHEENLRRRSQPPPPMTLKPRLIPEYALIRPITTHLQHRNEAKSLTTFLQTIIHPLFSAGIPWKLQTPSTLDPRNLLPTSSTTTLNPHTLLKTLTQPPITTLTLQLPTTTTTTTATNHLKITLQTNLNPPTFRTEYSFTPQTLTYPSITLTLPNLSDPNDVKKLIRQILTVNLIELIASNPHPTIHPRSIDEKAAATAIPNSETGPQNDESRWTPLDPHAGSLARGNERLYIRVWDDRLGLRYLRSSDRGDVMAWLWDGERETEVGDVEGGTRRRVERRALLDLLRVEEPGRGN